MYGIYLKKRDKPHQQCFLPIFRPNSKPLRQEYNISPFPGDHTLPYFSVPGEVTCLVPPDWDTEPVPLSHRTSVPFHAPVSGPDRRTPVPHFYKM